MLRSRCFRLDTLDPFEIFTPWLDFSHWCQFTRQVSPIKMLQNRHFPIKRRFDPDTSSQVSKDSTSESFQPQPATS